MSTSCNGHIVHIHCEIFAFQERNNPCLVSDQLRIFECQEDVVPEHDFLLRLGIGMSIDMVYLVGSGRGNSVEWDALVD